MPDRAGSSPDPEEGAPRGDPTRRLRTSYLIALSLVGLLSLAGVLATHVILARQEADAPFINLAGRQRMWSQRLAKEALLLEADFAERGLAERAAELRTTLEIWTRAHETLKEEAARPGVASPSLHAAFEALEPHRAAMHDATLDLLSAALRADHDAIRSRVARILEHEQDYLLRMDHLVSLYEAAASRRVARLERLNLLLTAAILFVLVASALLVFEPAVRLVGRQFRHTHRLLATARRSRERAEKTSARLRESEARYRVLAEHANDLIVEIDRERRLLYVSPSHLEVLGRGAAELEGHDCLEFCHRDDRAAAAATLARLFEDRSAGELLVRFPHAKGGWRFLEARAQPYETGSGTLHAVVVSRDVTERKQQEAYQARLEQQMRQTQKLESLGMLAGGIAHDFNNLLTAMLGNAQLTLTELPPGAPARARLERLVAVGRRAADLTNQLLTYVGRRPPALRPIDLSKLVEEMAELLRASVPKKVTLECRLAPDLPAVEADPTQMRQVVMNLILNASEAIGDAPGTVRLTTETRRVDRAFLAEAVVAEPLDEGPCVALAVSDTGPGMDEKTQARIFDPFFTTKFEGRGLGLAAVLGITRSHGGALRVTSERERGTTFTLVLPPALRSERARRAERAEPALPREGGRVLVVDDEDDVREVVSHMLSRLGFEVLTARDGAEGVALFAAEGERIDAVLLDLTMPRMSGVEALREMRRTRPDAKVILMTGYSESWGPVLAAKGFAASIPKPFEPDELAQALESTLGRRSG